MARSVTRLLLSVAVTVAAACSSDGVPDPLNHIIDPVDARRIGYRHLWSTDLGIGGDRRISHAVVLGDIVVLVESPTNLVYVLSMRDGATRRVSQVGTRRDRLFEPQRRGDELLINSESDLFIIEAATGTSVDVQRLKASVAGPPALYREFAVFGGLNGHLFAHDIESGFSKWAYDLGSPIQARPVLSNANVFAANVRGEYRLLTAATGNLLSAGRTFGRVSAPPVPTNLGIFVASEDHTLYALSSLTLKDRWKYRTPRALTRSPVLLEGVVYLPVPGHGLVAIDALGGERLWGRRDEHGTPVDLIEDKVLVNADSHLLLLATQSGRTLARVRTLRLKAAIRTVDDGLILVSRRGRLMRLGRD